MQDEERQTFYREVHVDDPGLALRRFVATNLRLRCPACGRSRVTEGLLGVKGRCPHCGSRFDRLEGNELISIALSFFLASLLSLAVALVLILEYGFFDGLMALLFGLAIVFVLALVRPMRVLALWLLWMLGFVYPDRVREKGRHVLPKSAPAESASPE